MRPLRGLQETRVATREESGVLGFPSRPWRRAWRPTPVFLPGESCGQRSLVGATRSHQSILNEISPEYSLEGLMLKLQHFGHLMGRTDSLEKTLMLGKQIVVANSQYLLSCSRGDRPLVDLYVELACLQCLPASGSFPVSQFFPSSGHSIGVSASGSDLPVNIPDRFPLRWTGWISLAREAP